jgi:formyl-CoA transferase
MTLNLKDPKGHAILMRMVEQADVVAENFRPDVKKRLGVDYDSLASRNSRIILASVSGFGQDGPYAGRPGFDQVAQGMGGLMSITGLPGQGPVRVGVPIADLAAGMYAAIGILIALLQREETGRGQWIHTSLLQAQIAMLDFQAARWLIAGDVPPQAGNNHPTSTPTGVFKTADGHMNLASAGEIMWQRLCTVLDADLLAEDPDYATEKLRFKNRDRLNDALAEYLSKRTSAEWIEALNEAGVPCGPIYDIGEVFSDPQVQHLGMAAPVSHPALGNIEVVNNPITMSESPEVAYTATPERSEHTEEVLSEYGYSPEEIESFRGDGTI